MLPFSLCVRYDVEVPLLKRLFFPPYLRLHIKSHHHMIKRLTFFLLNGQTIQKCTCSQPYLLDTQEQSSMVHAKA